jgi:hypothetical protein
MQKNMLKKIATLIFISFLFIQCSNENKYILEKGKVGLLTTQTAIFELKTIFENDSIVSQLSGANDAKQELFLSESDQYEIYSKEGKKLLEIVPMQLNDSTSKIKSIQIFDDKYKTKSGVGLKSTFGEINNNYKINKVETTLTSATLYIDELNATISIDKEELGISKFSREEISVDQIPDVSKIKFFTIWFN